MADKKGDCENKYMGEALKLAGLALLQNDVPVGAVVTDENGQIIGRGYNTREAKKNPLGHAELTAIAEASKTLGRWRLNGCTIYVTVEPCPMCAGAIQQARIDRLVYGCDDPKAGAAGSLYNIPEDSRLAHQVKVTGGICEQECRKLLESFFKSKRD